MLSFLQIEALVFYIHDSHQWCHSGRFDGFHIAAAALALDRLSGAHLRVPDQGKDTAIGE